MSNSTRRSPEFGSMDIANKKLDYYYYYYNADTHSKQLTMMMAVVLFTRHVNNALQVINE